MAPDPANRRAIGPTRSTREGEPPGDAINQLQKQPETRPISQDQLLAEVKGIYSGLVMVESRCIDVDKAQTSNNDKQDWNKLDLLSFHLAHYDIHNLLGATLAPPHIRRAQSASGNDGGGLSVPGSVNGFSVHALPDTGADVSFISLTLARQLGVNMAPPEIERVKLASGRSVKPLASVHLDWKFQDESKVYPVVFHVLKDLARPLFLGSPFLQATQTLTKYKNRLLRVVSNGVNIGRRVFQCNLMGGQTERIGGYLDGVPTFALPDTGSSVMAVSTALAVRRGWTINTSAEHRVEVQFGDGSIAFTRGIISGLDWDFGNGDGPVHEDYYVLDDLPVDVVLSGDFVLDMDLFSSKYADFFVQPGHTYSADGDALFCAIRRAKNKPTRIDPATYWGNANVFTHEIERREWDRQDQADAEISKLPESEQPERRAAEEKKRQDYEVWKASTQGNSPGTDPSPTSSSGDTGTAGELPARTPGLVSQGTSPSSIDSRPPHASPGLNIGFFAGMQQRLQNTKHPPRQQRNPPREPQEPGHSGNGPPLSTSDGTLAPPTASRITLGNVSSKPSGPFARLKNKYIARVRKPPMQPVEPQQDTSAGDVPVPALGASSGTPAPPAATQSSSTSSPA
ncbi:hypothetical protein RB598_009019 [Gaeumannomyces tritici]